MNLKCWRKTFSISTLILCDQETTGVAVHFHSGCMGPKRVCNRLESAKITLAATKANRLDLSAGYPCSQLAAIPAFCCPLSATEFFLALLLADNFLSGIIATFPTSHSTYATADFQVWRDTNLASPREKANLTFLCLRNAYSLAWPPPKKTHS